MQRGTGRFATGECEKKQNISDFVCGRCLINVCVMPLSVFGQRGWLSWTS